MRDALDRLGDETTVAVVTFSTDELVLDYAQRLDLPFPVEVEQGTKRLPYWVVYWSPAWNKPP